MNATIIQEKKFYNVRDVSGIMQVSQSQAYRIIRELNDQLKEQGKITVAGKVSRRYFDEKTDI